MRRREFIAGLGAAAWPLAARAQQSLLPVIGYLSARTAQSDTTRLAAFREGLGAEGFIEGKNVAIDYRFADGEFDRLPALASDFVRHNVAVIFAASGIDALAAKAASRVIPIVFNAAIDPVRSGLVSSLNRPGGNLTGVALLNLEVGQKRLELLHEMVPAATTIALLVNPVNTSVTHIPRDVQLAATALGLKLPVLHASTERDLETAFTSLGELRAGALLIGTDPFFTGHSEQLGELTVRHAVPAIYQSREFTQAGGLMSYGGNIADAFHTAGRYVGRILKGEKPSDLPVQQATRVQLVINRKTAKALGLTIPETLLATADQVIE